MERGNEEFVAITKRNRGAAIAEMECVIEIRPRADARPHTEREGTTIAVLMISLECQSM